MKLNDDKKAGLVIIGIFVIIALIIIIPLAIINPNKNKGFPGYESYEITPDMIINPNEYSDLRNHLQNDMYFTKLAIMNSYSKETYKPEKLGDSIWDFIFNFERSNTKRISKINKNEGYYCLLKDKVIEAFEELYDRDFTEEIQYFNGYHKYVFQDAARLCFKYNQVSEDYNNEIFVGVERVAMNGVNVIADLYVYEVHHNNTNTEKELIMDIKNSINNQQYDRASTLVKGRLKGKVSHRQIIFFNNPNGKYFKYKVISIKNLEY